MAVSINGPILTNIPYYYVYSPYDAESSLIEVQGNIQEVEKNHHGRSSLAYVGLAGTVIFLIYYFLISILSPMLIVAFTAILGALALFLGFRYFSRHLLTANIPVSKIFAAPVGLGIFNVQFAPENGQPLISPLTKTPCVLYSVALIHQVNSRYNYGNNSNVITYLKRGTHSMLTDGTGYIVMRLADPIGYVEGLYKTYRLHIGLLDNAAHVLSLPKELQPLKEAIDNARNNDTDIDLTNLISNLKVSATEQKVGAPLKGFRNGYYLVEYTIPVNKDYTAIGFLDHTEKQLNNKPVSKLVRDPQTKLFDLRYGPEKIVTHKYDKKAYTMFAMGMIAFIVAYLVGSYHNFYECLGIVQNNNTNIISCQYVNGTTGVIYRPQAQPASSAITSYTTISASGAAITIPPSTTTPGAAITIPSSTSANFSSCGNFSIVDSYISDQRYGVCSWNGGILNVSVAGGNSGFAGVKIIGEQDNKTYFSTGTNVRCLTNLGSFYAPAQQYKVELSTGRGYGACGADIVYLSSS